MEQRFELRTPSPAHDPEFARPAAGISKSRPERSARSNQDRRIGILGIALAVVWAGVLMDPVVRPLVMSVLAGLSLTLGVVLGAMALGLIGRGLFAIGDRFAAWLRAACTWPDE